MFTPINGEKIRLRPLTPDDLPQRAVWTADEALCAAMGANREDEPFIGPEAELRENREWFEERCRDGAMLIALETPDGHYIGDFDVTPDTATSDAEMTFFIGDAAYRRRGLGREAFMLLAQLLKDTLGIKRIVIEVTPGNEHIRFWQRLGFVEIGNDTHALPLTQHTFTIKEKIMKTALQLWSVREDMEKDFFGTLEKVAKMGYDGVEFAGYYGNSAADIKKALDALGLEAAGTHSGINPEKFDEQIAFEKELGNKNFVVPAIKLDTREDLDHVVALFKKSADTLKQNGMALSYHNHDFEFKQIDGKYILDLLFDEVGLDKLNAETDVYWVLYAGLDPADYIKKFKGAAPLIHLKDMSKEKKGSTIVGTGKVDMKAVIKQAKANGTEWLVIEQEEFEKPALECVADGLANVKAILAEIDA